MTRRVAIHKHGAFVDRWSEAARARGAEVLLVDGYSTALLEELKGCQAFLWQLSQDSANDLRFARSILSAAETMGLEVLPNARTREHFDDKAAQAYLLSAAGAPIVPTWVLYSREDALRFLANAEFPLVFKLRRGAGSQNVWKVNNEGEGRRAVSRMFGKGIRTNATVEKLRQAAHRRGRSGGLSSLTVAQAWGVLRNVMRRSVALGVERDYVLFQRFVPENTHDIRVTIIGHRAFTFRRRVRPGDFRASGSGMIEYYAPGECDRVAVEAAFRVSERFGFQAMAYDFVVDRRTDARLILEMSYGYLPSAVFRCGGYFDRELSWHEGSVWPEDAMIEDLLP